MHRNRNLTKRTLLAGAGSSPHSPYFPAADGESKNTAHEAVGTQAAVKPAQPKQPDGLPGTCREVPRPEGRLRRRPAEQALAGRRGLPVPRVRPQHQLQHGLRGSSPKTYEVIETIRVGAQPQHVVPSWDMKTLWVDNNRGNTCTPIDPRTGKAGKTVKCADPYNLYFTPDGKYAIVMASLDRQLVFRGRARRGSREDRAGQLLRRQPRHPLLPRRPLLHRLLRVQRRTAEGRHRADEGDRPGGSCPPAAMPQDVETSPDGKRYYIADMVANGVWILDGDKFTKPSFLPTGKGCHGLYVSRDSREMYISNRGEGTISGLRLAQNRLTKKWRYQHGGSPDMGGVSADGKVLWLSGR